MSGASLLASAAPVGLTATVFVLGAIASLAASALLVTRLERVGARIGLSEASLGMTAALAANGPEITSAVTALARGERTISAGVVLGSCAFNVAALLGLSVVVARRVELHRRVIALGGGVALWVSLVALVALAAGGPGPAGLLGALVVFAPYVVLLAWPGCLERLGLPAGLRGWLRRAVVEEEAELAPAIHPRRGNWGDAGLAGLALGAVIGASIAMEWSASSLGAHYKVPSVVIGAVVLAAVTSLPNAVAAVYLARRGRGSAVLSEALNSNNLNLVLGLLLPAAIAGTGDGGAAVVATAAVALGLSALALTMAYTSRGLWRTQGAVIIVVYALFVAGLVAGA
jgi:cation:H+ antiporter